MVSISTWRGSSESSLSLRDCSSLGSFTSSPLRPGDHPSGRSRPPVEGMLGGGGGGRQYIGPRFHSDFSLIPNEAADGCSRPLTALLPPTEQTSARSCHDNSRDTGGKFDCYGMDRSHSSICIRLGGGAGGLRVWATRRFRFRLEASVGVFAERSEEEAGP